VTYSLKFHPDALTEWNELPASVKDFFKSKLEQRIQNPHIPKSRLSGGYNLYKIKRKRPPFRLTYHVNDNALIITALSIGKRDGDVYKEMLDRLRKEV